MYIQEKRNIRHSEPSSQFENKYNASVQEKKKLKTKYCGQKYSIEFKYQHISETHPMKASEV